MKKSITIVGKMLLKSALVLAGFLAFLLMVGEPSDAWFDWARKTFGWFAYGMCIVEKVLAGLAIYLVYKLDSWIGPVFEEEVEPKTAEE